MENEFGILKQTFKEFLKKIKLHITIVLDMFNVYCFLHSLMLGRKKMDVEGFTHVIQFEALQEDALNTNGLQHQFEDNVHIEGKKLSREQHRHNMEVYLVVQRY